ncbi:hypothetical protein HNR48_001947 [Pseudoteredinibacter isoporae]|uniref:Uncharacterized protein n=1 Tax=Pseudoteredinibacter isoporae TaxID=570281 RepID=A0A7X0JT51_9GAMM|nr:hypothetical protein [Pseudoteredinibacter isoporae]
MYIWKFDSCVEDDQIAEYSRDESPDRFLFREGKRFDSDLGVPKFEFERSSAELSKLDSVPNTAMVPLVSSKFAIALRSNYPKFLGID